MPKRFYWIFHYESIIQEVAYELYPSVVRGDCKYFDFTGYYVAYEDGEAVGITGLFIDDPGHLWLGWFGIRERFQGFGRQLLDWTWQRAKTFNKKSLRILTSDLPQEAAAQTLYESMGFKRIEIQQSLEEGQFIRERMFE